jgi:hypothetical protein
MSKANIEKKCLRGESKHIIIGYSKAHNQYLIECLDNQDGAIVLGWVPASEVVILK